MQGADTVMHNTLLSAGPLCPAAIEVNFLYLLQLEKGYVSLNCPNT